MLRKKGEELLKEIKVVCKVKRFFIGFLLLTCVGWATHTVKSGEKFRLDPDYNPAPFLFFSFLLMFSS